jgi:hypothetical protein
MQRLAGATMSRLQNGEIRLAQATDVYYGYCFDTGLDEYCYWYPASDVVVTDRWVVYSP